jgi:CHAD domain-containing protein
MPVDLFSPVDDAYHTVLSRLAMVDAANVATIHRVRIAFKRFRYSFEIVQPLLTDMPEDLPAQMHSYQTLMGEIQDAEVLLRTLEEYTTRTRKDGADLTPVRQFLRAAPPRASGRLPSEHEQGTLFLACHSRRTVSVAERGWCAPVERGGNAGRNRHAVRGTNDCRALC